MSGPGVPPPRTALVAAPGQGAGRSLGHFRFFSRAALWAALILLAPALVPPAADLAAHAAEAASAAIPAAIPVTTPAAIPADEAVTTAKPDGREVRGQASPPAAVTDDRPGRVDTAAFNDFFTKQSPKLYGHLQKTAEYCEALIKQSDKERLKDALAARASLSACWEIFLNAGDMVYVYDLLDEDCETSLGQVAALLETGLGVLAGKLDKELGWIKVTAKNLADAPVAAQLRQAEKDIKDTAAELRKTAGLFVKSKKNASGGDGRGKSKP